jgi:hypothetical protein
MAERRQKIRGTSLQLDQDLGAQGLLAYDTERKELRVYDGILLGGYRIPNLLTIDAAYKLPERLTTIGEDLLGAGHSANEALTNGWYYTDAATTDQPEAVQASILVETTLGGQVVVQTWTSATTANRYVRKRSSALVWTAWNRIVDQAYLTGNAAAVAYDADRLDGQLPAYYTAINARLGYTAANKAGEAFTGNVSVGGTFGVTGATTLASTLAAGASTLASATITGAATIGTTLGVSGATTLASLTVSGASTLASLSVTGAGTVTGNFTVNGTLDANGASTLSATSVTTLTATGTATMAAVNATNIAASGTLGVTGVSSLAGTTVTTLTASGAVQINSTLGTTQQITIANTGPVLRLQDTTASAYDGRLRLDANNLYIDGSSDGVSYAEVLRFELDTKVGYMSQLILGATEGIRINPAAAGVDPYMSFYVAGVRQAYIQFQDGVASGNGLRFFNDVTDDILYLSNVNNADALKFYDSSLALHNTVWHTGNLTSADISTLYGYTPADRDEVVTAGNGLTGGGTLVGGLTVTLGTPTTISNSTTNSVTSTSHTHALDQTYAAVYTGSSATNTNYPIGTMVTVVGTEVNRCASAAVDYSTANNTDFVTSGGVSLSGTWRGRGRPASGNTNMERTA